MLTTTFKKETCLISANDQEIQTYEVTDVSDGTWKHPVKVMDQVINQNKWYLCCNPADVFIYL